MLTAQLRKRWRKAFHQANYEDAMSGSGKHYRRVHQQQRDALELRRAEEKRLAMEMAAERARRAAPPTPVRTDPFGSVYGTHSDEDEWDRRYRERRAAAVTRMNEQMDLW